MPFITDSGYQKYDGQLSAGILCFHNSPKRQHFLEHIIRCWCPFACKNKINGLCKTRLVERHNTFTTILELFPYLVKTWEQICYPYDDDNIYPDGNNWKWDSESRNSANGLKHRMDVSHFWTPCWPMSQMVLSACQCTEKRCIQTSTCSFHPVTPLHIRSRWSQVCFTVPWHCIPTWLSA